VLLRHNGVVAEWHHLYAQGLSPTAVSDEPLIYSGQGGNAGAAPPGKEPPPELWGDIGVHGFWRRGATAIFNVRVIQIPTLRTTEARILTRSWPSTRRRRRTSTLTPAWLSAAPSLLSCFWRTD
jgi:hypothetical protein